MAKSTFSGWWSDGWSLPLIRQFDRLISAPSMWKFSVWPSKLGTAKALEKIEQLPIIPQKGWTMVNITCNATQHKPLHVSAEWCRMLWLVVSTTSMQSQVPVAMPTGDNQAKPRDASQIALKASRMNLATHSMLITLYHGHFSYF